MRIGAKLLMVRSASSRQRLCAARRASRTMKPRNGRKCPSNRGRCSRSSGQVPHRRDGAIPKRWANCRAWADGAAAAARFRSGARQASGTAERVDWPAAIRYAAYDRDPNVRANGHGHPGRKHRCSPPTPELLPPGSVYAYALQLPPHLAGPQPRRDFVGQPTVSCNSPLQRSLARLAPISPLSSATIT
jgi:hypothetical protein